MFFLKAALVFSVIGLAMSSSRRTERADRAQNIIRIPQNYWSFPEINDRCVAQRYSCIWNEFMENVTLFCSNIEVLREDCIEKLSKGKCPGNRNEWANDLFLWLMLQCPESSYQCLVAKINCERNATQPNNLARICNNLEMVREGCREELIKATCVDTERWVNDLVSEMIKQQCLEFFRKCDFARETCTRTILYWRLTWVCNNLEMLIENCTEVLSEAKCGNWEQWLDAQISRVKEHCPFEEQLTPIFRCLFDRSGIIFQKAVDCNNKNSVASFPSCHWQASRDCCPRACELPTLLPKRYGAPSAIDVCNSPASSCDESDPDIER